MNALYLSLADSLRADAPECGFIDIYKGQTERPDLFDVIMPSVLISLPDTSWDNIANSSQIGDATIVVRWLVQLQGRTHAADTNTDVSVEQLSYADTIHEAIIKNPNIFRRTRTRRYPVPALAPNVFVVEHTYIGKETYIRPIKTIRKPDPSLTARLTFPSRINQTSNPN